MNQPVLISRAPLDAAPNPLPPPATEFSPLCQICLCVPASVFQICGAECLAEVCDECIVNHLTADVDSFYPVVHSFFPGALPKIYCPVCLNLLNKTQWQHFVLGGDDSYVLDKYKTLCRRSCGFESPCCHNPNYSMLPECYQESNDSDGDYLKVELPIDQAVAVDELYRRGVEFCFHRQTVERFYHFLTSVFQDNVDKLLWLFLPKIVDEERRATLLLRHLNKNPDTWTHCCKQKVCFKCKVAIHHNGSCRGFIEDERLVECRGCGVTVAKVERYKILYCVCGYEMVWAKEVARQRAQRKLLAPTDDVEYDIWLQWHEKMSETLEKVKRVYRLGSSI